VFEAAKSPTVTGVRADWVSAAIILIFAAALRIAFFSRGLGTDEIVYISQAYRLLEGQFPHSTYLGAVRYGINGFQALSIELFGNGVVGAAGLFFICSLGIILLAYCFAYHLWGRRAAMWSALCLAVLPLDVTLAGSLNPDPYLALFIAASLIVLYFAEREDRSELYFLGGLLAGWVFWIKEEVIAFGLVFVFLALSERRWRRGWLWFLFGGALCAAADLVFFWIMFGDPLYHYRVVHEAVGDLIAEHSFGETAPWAYLSYLFVKMYHTGLLGWLALAGGMLMLRRSTEPGRRFVLGWAVGLLIIFSLIPASLTPFTLIRKQANYMEIFMMPLALLAGWFLAHQRRGTAVLLGGAMIASGVLLSALEQQVVRVVTINGRAAAVFAAAHAGTPTFGPLTARRQSMVERLFRGSLDTSSDIRPWADLSGLTPGEGPAGDIVAYLVDDPQMRIWPDATEEPPLSETFRRCLVPLGPLEHGDLGLGRSVVATLRDILSVLPAPYAAETLRATGSFWHVSTARVYVVTRKCAQEAQGKSASRSLPPRPALSAGILKPVASAEPPANGALGLAAVAPSSLIAEIGW
jgi:4-amino-4-deoxy-L-arabinose transferase-like glycosyltransferase